MRRLAAVVLLVAAALPPSLGGARSAPALRLVDRSPLTVSGSGFLPRERVRVTFVGSTRSARTTVTSRTGTIAVVFADTVLGRCQGARFRAVGARGDLATLKIPLPACMPVRSP